ncbi:MAG: BPSL0067 family protein [Acetobacteraceae bacterium]|nr:BPSL0067 family protein [Acetobacteraceae bacterium]
MITAVQEQERQRQRTRSAASGPAFSVPLMSGLGAMQPISPPASACVVDSAPAPSAAPTGPNLGSFIGRSVGSGQCVALVKAANPSLGPASSWTAGEPVQGNRALAPGTPIATFDGDNRYANATDGSSHAAIYLGQDQHGITVLDQWAGSSAAVRTIPWLHPGGTAANTGSAFHVVGPA